MKMGEEDIFGNPNPFGKEVLETAKKIPGFKSGIYHLTRELTLHKGVFVPKDYFKWNIEYGTQKKLQKVIGKLRVDVIEKGPRSGQWIWEVYGTRGFEVLNTDYTPSFSSARGALFAFVRAHKKYLEQQQGK